jgi:hypothetical protein
VIDRRITRPAKRIVGVRACQDDVMGTKDTKRNEDSAFGALATLGERHRKRKTGVGRIRPSEAREDTSPRAVSAVGPAVGGWLRAA